MSTTDGKTYVLVTGSTGMLGTAVMRALAKLANLEVVGISRSAAVSIDLSEPGAVTKIPRRNYSWIVHTAANVNVDSCETERGRAEALHVGATRDLVRAFPSAALIYISTDAVFNGERGGYAESDTPAPLNYYSVTKLAGEKEAALATRHYIWRLSLVGFNQPFRNSLAEWAIKAWEKGHPLPGFADVSFNPLYCGTVAGLVANLVGGSGKGFPEGILHLGTSAAASKFDFLVKLASTLGYPKGRVLPSSYTEAKARFAAPRPQHIWLSTKRAAEAGMPISTMSEEIQKLAADLKSTTMQGK